MSTSTKNPTPYLFEMSSGGGSTFPGWPECNTLAGLLDAIQRWDLNLALDQSNSLSLDEHPERKPFRSPLLGFDRPYFDVRSQCMRLRFGAPIYPDHPEAVAIQGNFLNHSFGFCVETDDPEVIAQLDAAIEANIERQVERQAELESGVAFAPQG